VLDGEGFDIGVISTILYCGISFCHSLAYDDEARIGVNTASKIHLINGMDMPMRYNNTIKRMVKESVLSVSSIPWTLLKHNRYVQTSNFGNIHPIAIECHVCADTGVVLFRRGHDRTDVDDKGLVGAAYVIPSVVFSRYVNDISKQSDAVPVKGNAMDTHALIDRVKFVANQDPTSVEMLIRNAAEVLFHINAICTHNSLQYEIKGSTKPKNMNGNNAGYRDALHKAWLHTYMLGATRFCGGVKSASYCAVYARLTNIFKRTGVCGWETLPYL
jgi:hypothetical protein